MKSFPYRIVICRLFFALCLFIAALPAGADTSPSDRFLLIVNTSSAMQRRAQNLQTVLSNLFASAFEGEIKPGDTIGLWTYNETLQAGKFPLQIWPKTNGQQVASAVLQFLKKQRFEKRDNFASVVEALPSVVKNSRCITIILCTDGENPIAGTPFDKQVNSAFDLNAPVQRKARMPFITIMRFDSGKPIGVIVNMPPWPVEFPKFPTPSISDTLPATNTPSNSPVVVAPLIISNPPPPVVKEVLVVTNQPNALPPAAVNPPTNEPARPVRSSNEIPRHTAAETKPLPHPVNSPAVSEKLQSEESTAEKPALHTYPDVEKPPTPPILWVGIGAAGMLALVVIYFMLRPSRPPERISLITRSMTDEKK